MDPDIQSDIEDQIKGFKREMEIAEKIYGNNPRDAENLTRLGFALFELSKLQRSETLLEESISKFNEALGITEDAYTLWCLGSAYARQGFSIPDLNDAMDYYEKAAKCFEKAVDKDPSNRLYLESVKLAAEFPMMHDDSQVVEDFYARIEQDQENINNLTQENNKNLKLGVWVFVLAVWAVVCFNVKAKI